MPAPNEIYSVRSARSKRKCTNFFGEANDLALHVGGSTSKLASFYGLRPAPQFARRSSGAFSYDTFDHANVEEKFRDGGYERSMEGRESNERSTLDEETYSLGSSSSRDAGHERSRLGRERHERSPLGRDADSRGSSKSWDGGPERSTLERSLLGRDFDSRGSSRDASMEAIAGSEAATSPVAGSANAAAVTAASRRGSSILTLDLAPAATGAASSPPSPPPRSSEPGGSACKLFGAATIACESVSRIFNVVAVTLSQEHRPSVADTVYPGPPRSSRSDFALRRSTDSVDQTAWMSTADRIQLKPLPPLPPLPFSRGSTRKLLLMMGSSCPIDISLREITTKGLPSLLQSRIAIVYFLSFLLTEYDAEMLLFTSDVRVFSETVFASNMALEAAAQRIFFVYMTAKNPLEINVSHLARRCVANAMKGATSLQCFEAAESEMKELLDCAFGRFRLSSFWTALEHDY
ncbi:hypothetical protein BDK51DRAFT_30027, partial [Blyttiomyces helicus]